MSGHLHAFGVRLWRASGTPGVLDSPVDDSPVDFQPHSAGAIIHTPCGKRSGAQMNPAVMLAFWSPGKVRGRCVVVRPGTLAVSRA